MLLQFFDTVKVQNIFVPMCAWYYGQKEKYVTEVIKIFQLLSKYGQIAYKYLIKQSPCERSRVRNSIKNLLFKFENLNCIFL